MSLISILKAGRRDFLGATSTVGVNRKPRTGWSPLECIEHVITVEERHLEWIFSAAEISPKRDPGKETRLFSIMRSRLTKVDTPDIFRPHGRFTKLSDAIAAFQAVRDRMVHAVREHDKRIYSIGVNHPYFGDINGAELVQLVDGHARRHADQIREALD